MFKLSCHFNNRLKTNKLKQLKLLILFNKSIFIINRNNNKFLQFRISKKFITVEKLKNNKYFLIVFNFSFYFLFFKLIQNFEFTSIFGWIYEVNIKGLGLFCYVENNKIKMCLGQSHGIIYKLPFDIKVNVRKNKIFFFGYSKMILMNFVKLFLKLKPMNKYKERGLILSTMKIKYKIGKKKKK